MCERESVCVCVPVGTVCLAKTKADGGEVKPASKVDSGFAMDKSNTTGPFSFESLAEHSMHAHSNVHTRTPT